MKTYPSLFHARHAMGRSLPTLLCAAGLFLSSLPSRSDASGWFLPTLSPAGEYHKYWAIGLSTPKLETPDDMQTLKDGTHIFAFRAPTKTGHIYLWDRISKTYNSPAVASTDPSFHEYTTMDLNNMTFVKNIYGQLRGLWGEGDNRAETLLMQKLWGEIARNGNRIF